MSAQSSAGRRHSKESPVENTVDALLPLAKTVDDSSSLDDEVEDGGTDAREDWVAVEEKAPGSQCGKLAMKLRKELQALVASTKCVVIYNS